MIRLGRRHFLGGLLAASRAGRAATAPSEPGIPGPYRGRVVAVQHTGSIVSGEYQALAVRQMLDKGMTQLTGAPTATEAWRSFFEQGDVVGIKLNPVGQRLLPHGYLL